jgi:hypothetical protein
MPIFSTHKYVCNPNKKTIVMNYMLSCDENYWPTSIISHNIPPIFHSSPTSCSLIACKLVHNSELFYTFYKNLTTIMQKYNWVISRIIVTPIRHNIFEGKNKQINNFCIFYFTICYNGNLKKFDMNI